MSEDYDSIGNSLPSTVGGIGSNASLDLSADLGDSVGDSDGLSKRDKVLSTHPDYKEYYSKWVKYQDTYDARNIYKYLFQHGRESTTAYTNRLKRSYYYNYVASVVDLMVSYIFHSPIERQFGDLEKYIGEIYRDVNLEGDTYQSFMEEVATKTEVFGHVLILVDIPKQDSSIQSEEDRKLAKIRPYARIITPIQLLDWELDKFNRFKWIKFHVSVDSDRSWDDPVDSDVCHVMIYSKTSWEIFRVDADNAVSIDSGVNALGEVPVVLSRNKKEFSHSWFGLSAVRDIADINIGILNWTSLGDEEIYERCLNILAMEGTDGSNISLSHHNVLEYEAGTQPPQYLVPGTTPLELIEKWIKSAVHEIYRLAKMGGTTGLVGVREATSGIAYAYEFNETNQALANKAEGLEKTENDIHRLFCKYFEIEWNGDIAYSREFGVEDFYHELELLKVVREQVTSETAIQALEKKILSKMFTREPRDLVSTILQEVEEADPRMVDIMRMFNPPVVNGGDEQNKREESSSEESGEDSEE